MSESSFSWRQVPAGRARPGTGGGRSPVRAVAVAGGAAAEAAWVATSSGRSVGPCVAVAIVVAATVAAMWSVQRRWASWVVAAGAACVLVPVGGTAGAVLAFATVVAGWLAGGAAPLPGMPAAHTAALPPMIGAGLLGVTAAERSWPLGAGVAIVAGALVVGWCVSRWHEQVATGTLAFGRAVGRVVSIVLFGFLGLVVVVLPWLLVAPVGEVRRSGSSWSNRRRRSTTAARPWAPSWTPNPSPGSRARRLVRPAAVVAMLVAIVMVARSADTELREWERKQDERSSPAFADAPWWPELSAQLDWTYRDPGPANRPLRYPMPDDVESSMVNVRDGERRTWRPPRCDCRNVVVWMYGGAAVTGLGQRDDHTIASELARQAWAAGIHLEVHNRGVPDDLFWEASQRFVWDVEIDEEPDVVVFLDGWNDLDGALYRQSTVGRLDGTPVDLSAERAFRGDTPARAARGQIIPGLLTEPDGAWQPDPVIEPERSATEMGAYVADGYRRASRLAMDTAAAHGVKVLRFWEPTAPTSKPAASEPPADRDDAEFRRTALREAAERLRPDVVDLSDVFDDSSSILFYDDADTNERGARIVASKMLATLLPAIGA